MRHRMTGRSGHAGSTTAKVLIIVGVVVGFPIAIAALNLFFLTSAKREQTHRAQAACTDEGVFRVGDPLQVEGLAMPENYSDGTSYRDLRRRLVEERFAYVEILHPPSTTVERYHLAELGDPGCEALLASEAKGYFGKNGYGGVGVPPELCIARESDTRSLAPYRYVSQPIVASNGTGGYLSGVQEAATGRMVFERRSFKGCKPEPDRYTLEQRTLALRNAIVPSREQPYLETIAPDPASPVRRFYAVDASDWRPASGPAPSGFAPVQEVLATFEAVDTDASMSETEFGRRFRNPAQSRLGLAWTRFGSGGSCLQVNLGDRPSCFTLPHGGDSEGLDTGIQWVLVEGDRLTSVTGVRWRAAQYRKWTPSIWLYQHDRDGNVLKRVRVRLPELGFHDGDVDKAVVDFHRTDKGYRMRLQELERKGGRIAILRDVTLDIPVPTTPITNATEAAP